MSLPPPIPGTALSPLASFLPNNLIAPLPPGTLAPDFSLPATDAGRVTLAALRGQPVVLVFAPPGWNPARAQQMALYNDIMAQVQPHGARLLGLEADGIWRDLDFTDSQTLRFPLLNDFDPTSSVARAYGVYGQQAIFVIDAEGIIRWSHVLPTGTPPRSQDIMAALFALSDASLAPEPKSSIVNPPSSITLSRRNFVATAFAASLALAVAPVVAHAQGFSNTPSTAAAGREANAAGGATMPVTLQVNGAGHRLNIEPRTSLLDALRENIGLTGTKKGCNQGACGACTVLVNGQRINSCLTLAIMHDGESITTVEGLARGEVLHPVQAAFIEHDGFQCGYCTSGQVVSAVACIKEGHTGSEAEIREWMSGNICRCGAYPNIVRAVQAAAGKPTSQATNITANGGQHESV